jgi:hypothetical protein
MNAASHLGRVLKLLRASIRAAGRTQAEVDSRIGRRRGYLSHVFQGRVDLKLRDLLGALEALEVEPGLFFQAVFPAPRGRPATIEDLVDLVPLKDRAALTGGATSPAGVAAADDDAALLARVRQALRAILAEPSADPPAEARPGDVPTPEGSPGRRPGSGGSCVFP